MQSLARCSLRLSRECSLIVGPHGLPLRRQHFRLAFQQQALLSPTSTLVKDIQHYHRYITTSTSRAFSQRPVDRNSGGEITEKEQKLGLTIQISDRDRADHQTLWDLVKARIPQAASRFLAAVPQDGQGNVGDALPLYEPIPHDVEAAIFLPFDSEHAAGRQAFWNTSAYLLGAALLELHGSDRCLLAGSPKLIDSTAGGSGFSYEYLLRSATSPVGTIRPTYDNAVQEVARLVAAQSEGPEPLTPGESKRLEQMMASIVSNSPALTVEVLLKSDALKIFQHNPFKIEKILASRGDTVKVVRIGKDFIDITPNGLVLPDLRAIKAIKLVGWSTATFTPSEPFHPASSLPTTQQLQLLRAVSFPDEKQLKSYVQAAEHAAQSSHQAIGTAQNLFLNHHSSPGTPFMLPHGVRLARKMERVIRDLYDVHEYEEVVTPQLYKKDLWIRSGHWQNYRDDMFSVDGFKEKEAREARLVQMTSTERKGCCAAHSGSSLVETDESFGLKPMNCPGHCIVFASQPRSARELPIRYAEWSPLHRNESSGALSGLTRVRRFHQDDAHIFCTQAQIASEIRTMLQMLSEAYNVFGFPHFELVLSTRPANFIGSIQEWDRAEQSLREAMDGSGLKWELNEADGAFYGPKIDVRLIDVLGRKHQTATVQLDFQLPYRFDLSYEDVNEADGHARPVMIHRAILGSVERFMAILIESQGTHWPFWISPRQASVIPVVHTDELDLYARKVQRYLSLGIDAEGLKSNPQDPQADQLRSSAVTSMTSRARPTQSFHIDVDRSTGTLAKRIKRAHVARYNFTLIVGEQELANRTVAVRTRMRGGGSKLPDGRSEEQRLEASTRLQRLKSAVGPEIEFKEDMGAWRVEDLRDLFCKLDSWHL